jgi:hypothetical protein
MTKLNTQSPPCAQTAVKCRFFAQYLFQDVFCGFSKVQMQLQPHHCEINFHNKSEEDLNEFTNKIPYLSLTPLSKITNSDAVRVAEIFGMKDDLEFIGKILCTCFFDNSDSETQTVIYNSNAKTIDYLRAEGYAVPFMGYSVGDLISFGWVRCS